MTYGHVIGPSAQTGRISGSLNFFRNKTPWVLPVSQDVTQKKILTENWKFKSDRLYIPLNSISEKVGQSSQAYSRIQKSEFYSKQAMRISTYNIPRIICRADFCGWLPRPAPRLWGCRNNYAGISWSCLWNDWWNQSRQSLLPLHSRARNVTSNLMPSIP